MNINIVPLEKNNLTELALIMSWRSNPDIYKFFLLQNSPLIWDEHYRFISESKNRFDFLVYYQMRPVGHVAISNTNLEFPEISIMLGERTLWGKGISSVILSEFLSYLRKIGFSRISAKISNSNIGSIRIFQKAGFINVGPLENLLDWSLYILDYLSGEKE